MKYFRFQFIFYVNTTTPLKNVTPLSQQPSLKIDILSSPLPFLKLVGGSNPQQKGGGFTLRSCKKKRHKKIKGYRKSNQKEPKVKRCLLILDSKPFRSSIKKKQSIGREFQSLAVQEKKLLTQTSFQHLGMVTEKSCNLLE